jgi:hypothetical protein
MAFKHFGHESAGGASKSGNLLQQSAAFRACFDRAFQRLGLPSYAAQARQRPQSDTHGSILYTGVGIL